VPLDPQAQAFIDKLTSGPPPPPPDSIPLEDFRAAVRNMQALDYDYEDVSEARDVLIARAAGAQLSARVYVPAADAPRPVVVWAHGGSWVRGSVEASDHLLRVLANESGCVIVGVEYRLAPETSFPGPVEDIYDALNWATEHVAEIDGAHRPVAVGGESSGANLAAAAALLARERGAPPLSYQVLIAPVLDATFQSRSWEELGHGYLLTRAQLEWSIAKYAPGQDRRDPLLSPLSADSHAGLPPALIVTGEYDPLRDDGERYAQALERAGVRADLTCHEGMIHHALLAPKAIALGATVLRETARRMGAALRVGAAEG
jgi:acetyl esterase/lipase